MPPDRQAGATTDDPAAADRPSSPSPPEQQQPEFTERPPLPDRDVGPSTIEDAYVRFIFHCNPSLPLESADTASLREAFRNPPRSGGKAFEPWRVFELVKGFYEKEIRTWAELTTKLGVEPPDPSKDESSQKVAQYGVRLKKWMNSLHVKAFFEYLMGIENDYWTKIPSDPDPLGNGLRDGVAVEDDMALRALLPHIRPKRGRKRPEDHDHIQSPAQQRQRLSPTSAIDDPRSALLGNRPPQTTHNDFFLFADTARQSIASGNSNDTTQTPLTRWPQSAITPTVRGRFWDDAPEPRSAITPSRPKLSSQRRGPKNVSSAWKPGGADGGGKVRGRPPINRTPTEDMREALTWWIPNDDAPVSAVAEKQNGTQDSRAESPPATRTLGRHELPLPTGGSGAASTAEPPPLSQRSGMRPARPTISLQVPERQGGAVRLATPPLPAVAEEMEGSQIQQNGSSTREVADWRKASKEASSFYERSNGWTSGKSGTAGAEMDCYFERMEDRTNIDALMAYIVQMLHGGEWFSSDGQVAESASLEECTAVANAMLESMYRDATSSREFFANLASVAAGRSLMGSNRMRCIRLKDDEPAEGNDDDAAKECHRYKLEWEYRFGSLRGHFGMVQKVPRRMWTRARAERSGEKDGPDGAGPGDTNPSLSADMWKDKYRGLLGEVEKREKELSELRRRVMDSLTKDGAAS